LREFQFVIPLNIFLNPFSKYFERNLSIKDTESLIKIYINLMLDLTLVLAIIFMIFQGTEYFISPVNINTGIYGSTFYMITGLHGAHVFIGTCFLFYCRTAVSPAKNFRTLFLLIVNLLNYLFLKLATILLSEKFSSEETDSEFYDEGNYDKIIEESNPIDHYGKFGIESFESAAWYWHFVDVVWIFVFGFVYVWSHLTVLDLQ
jgi:cytochrome c oxidase subunit 3